MARAGGKGESSVRRRTVRSGIGATYNLLSVFDAGEQPEPSRTTASTSTRTSFSRDKGRSGGKPSENILALLTCICSVERARLAALFMPQVETVESCAESRKTFLNRPLFPPFSPLFPEAESRGQGGSGAQVGHTAVLDAAHH